MSNATNVPSGQIANSAGRMFENTVSNAVAHKNYTLLNKREAAAFLYDITMPPYAKWYTEQARFGQNIYQADWKIDIVLFNADKFPDCLVIECKWQASSGSVDEKYPFTVLSLKNLPQPSVLVLDGGGARKKSIEWIKRQQTSKFKFMTLPQFLLWAQTEL